MAKRFLINLSILLGCALAIFLGFAMVLILAPGTEFLGVKYIRGGDAVGEIRYTIADENVGAYESVVINSKSVPVFINQTNGGDLNYRFCQKYVGFTRSKIESPSITLTDEDGVVTIKTNEFVRFIYGNNLTDDFYLVLNLPSDFTGDLTINGKKSDVFFNGGYASTYNNVTLVTEGKVEFNRGSIIADFTLRNSAKPFVLPSTVQVNGNIVIDKGAGDVKIYNALAGNINFKSSMAGLYFNSCNDLVFNSKTGKIGTTASGVVINGDASINSSGSNISIYRIGGDAAIKTGTGSVVIGKEGDMLSGVLGTLEIKTSTGNITLNGLYVSDPENPVKINTSMGKTSIGSVDYLNINADRGSINILETEEAVIKGGIGDVSINKVGETTDIVTSSGKVALSSPSSAGTIAGSKVTTITGTIKVYNAIGTLHSLKTNTGKIDFAVKGGYFAISTELKVESSRGSVNAQGLIGKTTIKTDGEIYARFRVVNGEVKIEGKDEQVIVVVPDAENPLYYDVKSAGKVINLKISGSTVTTEKSSTHQLFDWADAEKKVTIKTSYGKINFLNETHAAAEGFII